VVALKHTYRVHLNVSSQKCLILGLDRLGLGPEIKGLVLVSVSRKYGKVSVLVSYLKSKVSVLDRKVLFTSLI